MRVGLVQLTVGDDPVTNLGQTIALVRQAVAGGAGFVLTPECTNCLSSNRDHQKSVFHQEADDPTLAALQTEAANAGIWLLIGSIGLKTDDSDGRFANRSFLISPDPINSPGMLVWPMLDWGSKRPVTTSVPDAGSTHTPRTP